jgi:hypothetical protein
MNVACPDDLVGRGGWRSVLTGLVCQIYDLFIVIAWRIFYTLVFIKIFEA